MRKVLLDTCIVSYLFKRDSRAERYRKHIEGTSPVINFTILGELYRWPLKRNWGEEKKRKLEESVRNFFVIPYDAEICRKWAEVTVAAERKGRKLSLKDSWIIATALRHNIPIITHNRSDFENVPDLKLISES